MADPTSHSASGEPPVDWPADDANTKAYRERLMAWAKEHGLGVYEDAPTISEMMLSAFQTNANWYHGSQTPETDMVNHPPHYQSDNGIECIDAIRSALGREGFIAYCKGQVLKYNWRAGSKWDAVEDAKKAAWYQARMIAEMEREGG